MSTISALWEEDPKLELSLGNSERPCLKKEWREERTYLSRRYEISLQSPVPHTTEREKQKGREGGKTGKEKGRVWTSRPSIFQI